MLIIIPVSRLHIEEPIILRNITLCSTIVANSFKSILIGEKNYSFKLLNKSKILSGLNGSFAIYYLEKLNFSEESSEIVERLIEPVDYALDSLRFSLNSFSLHEQAIGTPGFFNGQKIAIVLHENGELNTIISGGKIYYHLLEGIGCDATGYAPVKNDILQLDRKDDVYSKYRSILHRLFKSMQIYNPDTCFVYLFSTIESLDCGISYRFQKKKRRILSLIAKDQTEFDSLSQQLYFYSKKVRTDIIHSGKSIFDFFAWSEVYKILDSLYFLIVKFCIKVFELNIKNFDDLEKEINNRYMLFVYHQPTENNEISRISTNISGKCIYLSEINNLNIDTCWKLGQTLLVPANFNYKIKELSEAYEYGLSICIGKECHEKLVNLDDSFPFRNLFSAFNLECLTKPDKYRVMR